MDIFPLTDTFSFLVPSLIQSLKNKIKRSQENQLDHGEGHSSNVKALCRVLRFLHLPPGRPSPLTLHDSPPIPPPPQTLLLLLPLPPLPLTHLPLDHRWFLYPTKDSLPTPLSLGALQLIAPLVRPSFLSPTKNSRNPKEILLPPLPLSWLQKFFFHPLAWLPLVAFTLTTSPNSKSGVK